MGVENTAMERLQNAKLRVDLIVQNGVWRAVVEHDGRCREMEGLQELIRYLQGLGPAAERPPRGLR